MKLINWISSMAMPLFVAAIICAGLFKKVDVYAEFVKGAKSGISTAFKVMPYVVGMIFAVDIWKAAGIFDYISAWAGDAVKFVGIPPEVLPLALMRPFSGGGSFGMLAGVFSKFGPDSYIGRVSSTFMGSSETLFYTVSLYFGSIGINKTRYVIPVALLTDLFGLIFSAIICTAVFGAA